MGRTGGIKTSYRGRAYLVNTANPPERAYLIWMVIDLTLRLMGSLGASPARQILGHITPKVRLYGLTEGNRKRASGR